MMNKEIIEKVLKKTKIWVPVGTRQETIQKKDFIAAIQKALSLQSSELTQKVENLKQEWRLKARRMEIMSGEVAIFELEGLIDAIFNEEDLK